MLPIWTGLDSARGGTHTHIAHLSDVSCLLCPAMGERGSEERQSEGGKEEAAPAAELEPARGQRQPRSKREVRSQKPDAAREAAVRPYHVTAAGGLSACVGAHCLSASTAAAPFLRHLCLASGELESRALQVKVSRI